jgi:uncharacterized membrane protein YfcA
MTAGCDLLKANAVKLLIILIYTVFAIGVFVYNNQINFIAGILLSLGSMTGSFVATRVAVGKGVKFVRIILITVVIVAAVKFLGIYDIIKSII